MVSSRPTPKSAQAAAAANAGLSTLLVLSWLPWDRIIESVPLPMMLIVGGSAVLAAPAWATKRVLSWIQPPS